MLRKLRYELRSRLSRYEWAYLALAAMKSNDGLGQTRVAPETDLVIEAFPRSGNTFAVEAFTRSQPVPVRVAHHFHAPAQVLRAARLGVPALVIIRPPRDAVLSFVIREPVVSIAQALRAWLIFYETLSRAPSGYMVATFDEVTTDFGEVIQRVNQTFGRQFVPFVHTQENVEACFDSIGARNAARFGRGEVQEHSVARPSDERRARKAVLSDEYARHSALHEKAAGVYGQLSKRGVPPNLRAGSA